MRNINELIGIIEGIQFDGIINSKEITRLQSWVDKNRNIVYDQRQMELIQLVDSVLEDQIINDNERTSILQKAEEFLQEDETNVSILYELNGIIDGIICDDVINDAEVARLREWMQNYRDIIRNSKESKELCETLDNILIDGVITEDEQAELSEILSARINALQLETKINYLCKQVKNRKNIGTDLIDVLDNEISMQEIHTRAEIELMKSLASYSGFTSNPEIIVVSLVLIALLEYNGNYYDGVRNTYKKAYKLYSEQKVEGQIRTILGRYKREGESASRSRIINVVLENAIVPQTYLTAFFEFIFDIYKLNFEYDIPQDPYDEFKFVYEGLRNNMLSEGDDISLNVTQKTYKLIVTTKHLITKDEGMDALIKFSILIMKLIDKRFWDKENKIFNPYLKVGYEGWEKHLKETSRSVHEYKKSTDELRSRWEPKFVMRNNGIYLESPVHRVKAQYDYRNIAIVVMNEGEEIYRNNDCDIREIIGGYQINSDRFLIKQPLGKVSYRLIAGNEIIYDSKDKLYRKYIVFNEDGNELNNNTDFEGTAYFCYKEGDAQLQNIVKCEHYCIGYKLVRVGDAVEINKDVFCFSSMTKPGIFGELHLNCKVKSIEDGETFSVFKEASILAFEADNVSSKFEIVINGKSHKMAEMEYKSTVKDNSTKYVVELKLPQSDIYVVEVNQLYGGKQNRILKETFAYDSELTYRTEKVDEFTHQVFVKSAIMSKTIDAEIVPSTFSTEFIEFAYKGRMYNYHIPFDLDYYRISNSRWCAITEDLWIDDIKADTVLQLYDSECDGLLVYNENGILAEDNIELRHKGYYKEVPISFLHSYKNANQYVLLALTCKGKVKHTIFCYNKCVMDRDKTEIIFTDNPKRVCITPVYHGKNKVFFEVIDNAGEKLYKSKLLSSEETDILEEFDSFEEYKIEFYEKPKGLQLKQNTLLLTLNKTFYAKKDFVGRVFKIAEIYYNLSFKGRFLEKTHHFNKAYIRFNEIIDCEEKIYEGEVFIKTLHGEWLLDGVNPVEVEMCSEVVDDTMDIYITNQGDGLLFDVEKRVIMNSLEHPTAPDIFLYTIKTKEEN